MFESGSGNVYEGGAHVDMGVTEGNSGVFLSGPRHVGGCQRLRLDAGRTDGSWDGILRWKLESATNATPTNTTLGSNHGELVTLIETKALGKTIVTIPPEMTTANIRYA